MKKLNIILSFLTLFTSKVYCMDQDLKEQLLKCDKVKLQKYLLAVVASCIQEKELAELDAQFQNNDQKTNQNDQKDEVGYGKKFICEQCDYTTSLKRNFDVHLKSHFYERPFKCKKCGNSFKLKHHLTNHLKIHTGKKYTCKHCGIQITDQSNYKRHLKKH